MLATLAGLVIGSFYYSLGDNYSSADNVINIVGASAPPAWDRILICRLHVLLLMPCRWMRPWSGQLVTQREPGPNRQAVITRSQREQLLLAWAASGLGCLHALCTCS